MNESDYRQRKPRFRVYALIHGEVLPYTEINGATIQKMSFEEQEKRKFAPIETTIREGEAAITSEWTTYVTSLRYVDYLRIKSEHVCWSDFYDDNPLSAIGGAFRKFEDLSKVLFFTNDHDKFLTHSRHAGSTYVFQIMKVYELDENGEEKEVEYELTNGYCFLPNRPDFNTWRNEESEVFLKEVLQFKDPIFQKSLAYFYRSSIGHFNQFNHEKIALDHFKSMEVIINSLSRKKKFLERLTETAVLIKLTQEEQDRIKKLWGERSNGDVAHAKTYDIARAYPNQFPLPQGVDYSGPFPDSVAETVLYKYYEYIKRMYNIEVEYDSFYSSITGELYTINAGSECNRYGFSVNKCSKNETIKKLKAAWVKEFSVRTEKIEILELEKDTFGRDHYSLYVNE